VFVLIGARTTPRAVYLRCCPFQMNFSTGGRDIHVSILADVRARRARGALDLPCAPRHLPWTAFSTVRLPRKGLEGARVAILAARLDSRGRVLSNVTPQRACSAVRGTAVGRNVAGPAVGAVTSANPGGIFSRETGLALGLAIAVLKLSLRTGGTIPRPASLIRTSLKIKDLSRGAVPAHPPVRHILPRLTENTRHWGRLERWDRRRQQRRHSGRRQCWMGRWDQSWSQSRHGRGHPGRTEARHRRRDRRRDRRRRRRWNGRRHR